MTFVIVAIVAILVLLALFRVGATARTTVGTSARPTHERRSGSDRRVQRVRVPRERRKAPRRFEDVAAAYVSRIDGARAARGHGPSPRG